MLGNIFRLSLRMQLLAVMLSMTALSAGSLVYLQKITEDRLFVLIQEEISGLTKAIEISVEQITTSGSTDEARLNSYIDQLRSRGIGEVSILSDQQEVILSSNPKMVGSRLSVSKDEFLIRAKIGAGGDGETEKIYNAFVPIISKDKLEGYVLVSIHFDDLEKLSKDLLYRRLAWTGMVFGIGVVLCIIISYRYTKPIRVLINAIRSISQGKIPSLPTIPQADIRGLAQSISDMVRKLAEEKTMEEKLKRAERQAMLVQFASGIAHEIRNPLNFIGLSVDHLSTMKCFRSDDRQGEVEGLIRRIKAQIRRADQMVTDLLDLGRELVLHSATRRADVPMEEALALSSHLIRDRHIAIERDFCDPVPAIEIDMDKMTSCFQNLITNAADAMPTGGTLRVSIKESADQVNLSFEDTGEGIRSDDLAKVYEPYFTTKQTGTGLGLAISKRIVEAHGGRIDVISRQGKGTNVIITLPRA